MPRGGPEVKPPWHQVPVAIRAEAEGVLGARIVRASRVYGGYAPSATFRLALSTGRRAFFKGVSAASNDFMRRALLQEERVYRELSDAISPWAPAFIGSVRHGDWHALLLEDLGPADVPPWTGRKVRDSAREFARFHALNEARSFPEWVPSWRTLLTAEAKVWELDRETIIRIAALAGERTGEAEEWIGSFTGQLHAHASRLHDAPGPYTLLYLDARADNVRCPAGKLRIFDWNWVAVGPAETDVAAFAEGITADAGPLPEAFVGEYRRYRDLRDHELDAAVAALAGFFGRSAAGPPRPDLPRIRSIQRRQFKVCLAWAARRLGLPDPTWVAGVAD